MVREMHLVNLKGIVLMLYIATNAENDVIFPELLL
jgi:hypothetical protein